MTDVTTRKPLSVGVDKTVGPYLDVTVSQLEAIRKLLDHHGIHYRVAEHAISLDGGPEKTLIFFGRKGDSHAVQAVLDSVP